MIRPLTSAGSCLVRLVVTGEGTERDRWRGRTGRDRGMTLDEAG